MSLSVPKALFLSLLCLMAVPVIAADQTINKSTATKTLEQALPYDYWHISYVGTFQVRSGTYKKLKSGEPPTYNTYAQLGLMDVQLKKQKATNLAEAGDGGRYTVVAVLTEKGEKHAITVADKSKLRRVAFPFFKLEIEKIVSINQDEVLFLVSSQKTKLGIDHDKIQDFDNMFEAGKLRGKATFKYDPFVERFSLTGLWLSPWEHESWKKTSWVEESKGEVMLNRIGID